jgi:heat shock protein HslJ
VNGRRLAATLAVLLLVVGCNGGSGGPAGALVGRWQLDSFQRSDGQPVAVPTPERFTVTFEADGRLSIRADCNTCAGTYRVDRSSLTFGPQLACTQAACPSAPFDREYVTALAGATSFLVVGNDLTIISAGGILGFSRLE